MSVGATTAEAQDVRFTAESRSDVELQGAQLRSVCAQQGRTWALVSIDVEELREQTRPLLQAANASATVILADTDHANGAGRQMGSARSLFAVADGLRSLEARLVLLQLLGSTPPIELATSSAALRARGRALLADVPMAVEVRCPEGLNCDALRTAAASVVAAYGFGGTRGAEGSAKIVITLERLTRQSPADLLVIHRYSLTAALDGAPAVAAATPTPLKSGGATDDDAAADAVRRATGRPVRDALSQLFSQLGLPAPSATTTP